jgi:ABC-2 type transport system ATP-binding protein
VLILDEPTVGLDPTQMIEVRRFIKSLAPAHTVLLSTHVLPEVAVICERVIIINHGRIAADEPVRMDAMALEEVFMRAVAPGVGEVGA